jgi:hypothetical protein
MNRHFVKMTYLVYVATAFVTSCSLSTEQNAKTFKNAKALVKKASQDKDITCTDSTEYANYKIEAEKKLRENELLIADMKDRMKSESKENRVKFKKQLDSLDLQNSQLRNVMISYSSEGKENRERFKKEFNTELDALGKAISQLAERNMKKAS